MLAPGAAFHRGDLRMIQAQIQSSHQLPNGAHSVLVIYQPLYVHGAQQQLSAINRYQSRNSGLVVDHACSLHIAASPAGSISSHVPVPGFTRELRRGLVAALSRSGNLTDDERIE